MVITNHKTSTKKKFLKNPYFSISFDVSILSSNKGIKSSVDFYVTSSPSFCFLKKIHRYRIICIAYNALFSLNNNLPQNGSNLVCFDFLGVIPEKKPPETVITQGT